MTRVGSRLWALCCLGLTLGGCAATDKLIPSTGGVSSAFGNLLAFNTTIPGPAPTAAGGAPERPVQCPSIQVLDGTASYRTYASAEQTNENVRYQFSMGELARECTHSGKEVLLKVGVEGRVLLGPAGTPGSFTVPVRIAVRHDGDGKVVAAKFFQVPATIAGGEDSTSFQVVSDPIAVPFVTLNADDDYTILVGFDTATKTPAAAEAGKKAHARGKRVKPTPDAPQG